MTQINSTLNDINVVKGHINKRNNDFEKLLNQTRKEIEKLPITLFKFSHLSSLDIVKGISAMVELLWSKIKYGDSQKSSDIVNEVIDNIKYIKDLFTIC